MSHSICRPVQAQPTITGEYKKTTKVLQGKQTSFAGQLQSVMLSDDVVLTISKHAKQRLEERGIDINQARWKQISDKVKEAKNMGVKESLVLLEDAALIVSVKNQTVITAMDRKEACAQIFTNINGTILME